MPCCTSLPALTVRHSCIERRRRRASSSACQACMRRQCLIRPLLLFTCFSLGHASLRCSLTPPTAKHSIVSTSPATLPLMRRGCPHPTLGPCAKRKLHLVLFCSVLSVHFPVQRTSYGTPRPRYPNPAPQIVSWFVTRRPMPFLNSPISIKASGEDSSRLPCRRSRH